MRLAGKLTAALVLGILVVMATYAYLEIRQEVVLYEADLNRARQIGLAWLGTIEAVWEHEGPLRVRELIQRADARAGNVIIRLRALDPSISDLERPDLSAAEVQMLTTGDVVQVVRHDEDGSEWRHIYAPITIGGLRPVAVELMEPLTGQRTFIRMSHLAIALATVAIVGMCGVIATGLQYWLVGRPLQLLRDKARRAGEGDFSGPLLLRQHDEIGDLARDINGMCERIAEGKQKLAEETAARIAALEQLRHNDRLATVGRLAAGVAHELGTPLNVISARAEMVASNEQAPLGVVAGARIIVEQADRMAEIIHQLLDFSRRRAAKPGLADLRHVVPRSLDLLSSVAEKARVTLQCDAAAEPVLAYVDQNQFQQALTNVVLNGIQSMPNGGRLRACVGMRRTHRPDDLGGPERDYVYVQIEDQGRGISPDQMAHIFEPFFTTKKVGEGTGLGLAVAHGIVTEHGGWIAVDSEVGRGSRFSIFLPQPAAGHEAAVA